MERTRCGISIYELVYGGDIRRLAYVLICYRERIVVRTGSDISLYVLVSTVETPDG